MTWLILAAAVIAGAAVWFIARPLRARAQAAPERESREGLVQRRDRLLAQLRELDVEIGDRNVDAEVAADERLRLEADLAQVLKRLDEAPPEVESPAQAASSSRLWLGTVMALVLALPLGAAGLYFARNHTVLAQLGQAQTFAQNQTQVPPMVLQMVERLEQRLAAEPDDPQGWARLGRSYAVLGREADARQAYARARELAPEDMEIMSAYAGFLLSISPTRPSAEAVALFRELHAADPEHPGALWALGMVAFQDEEFGRAAGYWEKLLEQLPPESEITIELRHALEVARERAAERE